MISSTVLADIKKNIGSDPADDDVNVNFSISSKAMAVAETLNNGGADIDLDDMTELELNCVSIGVNDLLNNNSGTTSFSPTFKMLAMQLGGKG